MLQRSDLCCEEAFCYFSAPRNAKHCSQQTKEGGQNVGNKGTRTMAEHARSHFGVPSTTALGAFEAELRRYGVNLQPGVTSINADLLDEEWSYASAMTELAGVPHPAGWLVLVSFNARSSVTRQEGCVLGPLGAWGRNTDRLVLIHISSSDYKIDGKHAHGGAERAGRKAVTCPKLLQAWNKQKREYKELPALFPLGLANLGQNDRGSSILISRTLIYHTITISNYQMMPPLPPVARTRPQHRPLQLVRQPLQQESVRIHHQVSSSAKTLQS